MTDLPPLDTELRARRGAGPERRRAHHGGPLGRHGGVRPPVRPARRRRPRARPPADPRPQRGRRPGLRGVRQGPRRRPGRRRPRRRLPRLPATALRRNAYDRTRAGSRVQVSDDLTPYDPGVPFVDPALEGLERSIVSRAYTSLPERWQTVLWHTEVEGLSPAAGRAAARADRRTASPRWPTGPARACARPTSSST